MDPITLVLRGDKSPAFPDPAGAVTLAENDGNLTALQTAIEQVNSEKQDTLVSGTNIKTINSTSLLGSGDIAITGSVSDGDKGDVTVSGSGATWTIDNDVVTNAKLANVATATIKGRATAGTGDPEDLTASQAKTLLAIGISDVSGLQTALDGKLSDDLATEITATKATPIGADQIIILDSADSDTPKLAALSTLPVSGGLSDGDKGDVTVSGSGATWTIDNGAVTNAKRADMAQATISGRAAGAGTGAPTDLSASQVRTILNVADGATANAGTVTSVGLSVPTGLSVSGSPVTSSGTLALSLTAGYVIPTQATIDAKLGTTATVGSSLGTTGTVNLDLAALTGTVQTIAASGNITFTTSNRAAGRAFELRIAAGGSSRTLTWPSWTVFGAALPTTLASGKVLRVALSCTGTTEASIDAAAAESV